MVKVTIQRNQAGRIIRFSACGHADYAKRGEDIVCAAVSAILQTAIAGLKEYLGIKKFKVKKSSKEELDVTLNDVDQWSNQTDIILETMVLGLRGIEREYGKYIKVIEKG